MNEPIEAKKSPEVKPWVRRAVEAAGVDACQRGWGTATGLVGRGNGALFEVLGSELPFFCLPCFCQPCLPHEGDLAPGKAGAQDVHINSFTRRFEPLPG